MTVRRQTKVSAPPVHTAPSDGWDSQIGVLHGQPSVFKDPREHTSLASPDRQNRMILLVLGFL